MCGTKSRRGPKPVGAGKSYASVSRRPGKAVWNRSHPESHQGTRDHRNSLITKVASPFGGTFVVAKKDLSLIKPRNTSRCFRCQIVNGSRYSPCQQAGFSNASNAPQ